jgi:copper chaperone CopZ
MKLNPIYRVGSIELVIGFIKKSDGVVILQETEIFEAEIDLESSGIKMEVKEEDIKQEVKEEEEEVLLDQVVEVVPCPGEHLNLVEKAEFFRQV